MINYVPPGVAALAALSWTANSRDLPRSREITRDHPRSGPAEMARDQPRSPEIWTRRGWPLPLLDRDKPLTRRGVLLQEGSRKGLGTVREVAKGDEACSSFGFSAAARASRRRCSCSGMAALLARSESRKATPYIRFPPPPRASSAAAASGTGGAAAGGWEAARAGPTPRPGGSEEIGDEDGAGCRGEVSGKCL